MQEVDGATADDLTLFLYEEIAALLAACDAVGLDRRDRAAIFHDNGARLLGRPLLAETTP